MKFRFIRVYKKKLRTQNLMGLLDIWDFGDNILINKL